MPRLARIGLSLRAPQTVRGCEWGKCVMTGCSYTAPMLIVSWTLFMWKSVQRYACVLSVLLPMPQLAVLAH